ncbi:MAG: Gfo/Idh/MocA family oxidoreductase [Treponema sp.]|jgi:predicted dehydrogenase|nr:Gfo/Idh/MocA family oxidoreductase [Treponema sp.]
MKRVAIIGSGYIGRVHAEAIKKSKKLELAGFADRDAEKGKKAAADFKVPIYADAKELLAKEKVDILDICIPTSFHEEYALLGAANKKHVICEKPFSLSSDSCKRMTKACADAGVKLMVAQVLRWFPEYQKIKEFIPKLGPVHAVYSNRLCQPPNWADWYRDPKIAGGAIFDLHLHNIDFLFSVFGPVDHVYAAGWKSPTGCWNHVLSTLVFKNGVNVVDEASETMIGDFPFTASFRATGDEGTLDYRLTAGFNIENLGAASNVLTYMEKGKKPKAVTWKAADAFQNEMEAFADAVEEGKPVPINPEDSIYCIKIIEALQRSIENGTVEKIK